MKITEGTERVCYSIPATAKMLSISPRLCWTLIDEGRLKAIRINRRKLVAADAITDFIKRSGDAAAEPINTEEADAA